MKEHIKAIAAFGILITLFMAGFTLSSSFWSSSNSTLQNDFRRCREETGQVREELEKTKLEYSHYRDSHAGVSKALQGASMPDMTAKSLLRSNAPHSTEPNTDRASDTQPSLTSERLTLRAGNSEAAAGGQMVISLIGTAFEGDPLRHKVTFSLGAPGAQTITYPKQDIGATVRWKKFEVRLFAADTFDATFMVTPLAKP